MARPDARRTVVRPRPTGRGRESAEAPQPGAGDGTRAETLPFAIEPVKPVGSRKINLMVYGPYGHGKTTFGGSAEDVPSMQDVLFINAESGDMSLTGRRALDVININKYRQLARIYEYLTLHCKWRDEGNIEKLLEHERKLKAYVVPVEDQTEPAEEGRTWFEEQRLRTGRSMDEPFMYRTVVIDSLSEVYKYLVYQFTGVDIGKTKLDQQVERMEEWQAAQEMFRLLVRSFRDLPMNTILIAAEVIQDPDRKKGERHSKSLPKFAGQMAGDIAGFIDIVGYLVREIGKDGETTRKLYLGAGYEDFLSKHRFENLPDLDYIDLPEKTSGMSLLIDLARKDAEAHGTRESSAASSVRPVSRGSSRAAAPQRGSAARSSRLARGGAAGRDRVRR